MFNGRTALRLVTLCALAVALATAAAQTREDLEKRIATLPADQQAFERFRLWIAGQPLAERGSQAMEKFRAYLKDGGFSDAEIAAQIEIVQKEGKQLEAKRWNRYFTAEKPAFNTKANGFLVEVVKGRKPGQALDVAMGQGRNSLWLAQQGWNVTGFDIADKAVAIAKENAAKLGVSIRTEIKSIEEFDFGQDRWDLILLSYAGGGQLVEKVQRALRPGGILVVEAFHEDALKTLRIGGSLFGTGVLPHIFQGLRSIRYEEPVDQPDFAPQPVRLVRFCAQKPVNP